jgi:hypothetical protein
MRDAPNQPLHLAWRQFGFSRFQVSPATAAGERCRSARLAPRCRNEK